MLNKLLEAHQARIEEGTLKGCDWTLERWILKLIEETGEIAECFTKDKTWEELDEEICDAVHVLSVLMVKRNISYNDLANKFNKTSEKKGSNVRMEII